MDPVYNDNRISCVTAATPVLSSVKPPSIALRAESVEHRKGREGGGGGKPKTEKRADLISMSKVLFDAHKAEMYQFISQNLQNGAIEASLGERVINREPPQDDCKFVNVSYCQIDRESFFANVYTEVKVSTVSGRRTWSGYIVFLCSGVSGRIESNLEYLCDDISKTQEELIRLDKYLVPVLDRDGLEEVGEGMWAEYGIPDALPRAVHGGGVSNQAQNSTTKQKRGASAPHYLNPRSLP